MFFSNKALSIFSLAAAVSALSVSYDQGYDDASRLMTAVACSDGPNGLITKYGWETQGAIPKFPNIGGWEGIEGWGSTNVRNSMRQRLSNLSILIILSSVEPACSSLTTARASTSWQSIMPEPALILPSRQ